MANRCKMFKQIHSLLFLRIKVHKLRTGQNEDARNGGIQTDMNMTENSLALGSYKNL